MSRLLSVSALFFVSLLGCGAPPAPSSPPGPARGELVSIQEVATYPLAQLEAMVAAIGLPDLKPANGVTFYRLTYRTPDVGGQLTVASGTVVVPDGVGPFPVLSDQHGTQTVRHLELTRPLEQSELVGTMLLFGARGWVLVGADYLGLGVNEGVHPYYHAETEGSATRDMLVAFQQFAAAQQVPLTGELFLTGYSQGAHVTMALHRALDSAPLPGLTVIGSAPMAGAFDLADISLPSALQTPAPSSSMYLAYALLSYERVYEYGPREALFQAPWDTAVVGLFDGTHTPQAIAAALPAEPTKLLQPAFVQAYLSDPQHPFRRLLRQNDVLDWTPRAPITFFHGRADVDVAYANAERALSVMQTRGANVSLVNVGDTLDHATASMPSYFGAAAWFASLRVAP